MTERDWAEVDAYLTDLLVGEDEALAEARRTAHAAGLVAMEVAPNQGKLLGLLVRMCGAQRVLEIGTYFGYSTIWLARAVGPDGRVTTLELEDAHADLAEANLARAGVADRVDVRRGPALATLDELVAAGGRYDLVFVDADKPSNPAYLERALALSHPGTVIVGDNVVRHGEVVDPDSPDDRVVGTRAFLAAQGADPRLDATAIQTVGLKGWDGFSLAVVR